MDNSYDELFDDRIKGKLEGFDAPGAPEGWDALESKMAADADLGADPFDEMIKSKLEGSNAAYDPGFWSLMESKIEADADLSMSEIDNVELDGLIYENLNSYNVPYNPNHWDLMLERIKDEFSIQRHLYKYKVAEVSLMVLAILTLLQFYPGTKDFNFAKAKAEPVAAIQTAETNSNSNESGAINAEKNLNNNSNTNESLLASAKKENAAATIVEKVNNINTTLAKVTEAQEINSVTAIAKTKSALPLLKKESYGGTSITEEQVSDLKEAVLELENQLEIEEANKKRSALLFDKSILGHLTLESAQLQAFENSNAPLPDCKWYVPQSRWAVKLGMFTSLDFNLVITPFDEYFSSASYDQLASGYTGGLSFSIHRKRLGFATGISYSSKEYEPRKNTEVIGSLIEGYEEKGFEATQLNILSVPANLTFNFDDKGKWQWYTLIGASAKLATINNFDVKSTTVTGSRAMPDPRLPPSKPTPQTEPENPYSGAFEGGTFKSNLFLTANLGFGMERFVTPRWSVFFQPTYQHSLYKKGLGPNKDRIHTMSLFLGTRATLK